MKITTGLLLLLGGLLLVACGGRNSSSSSGEILAQYLPSDWSYVTTSASVQGFQSITIDGDADNEWLLFFHYDSPPDQTNGPIGGIIYDVQQNSDYFDPSVAIPFPFQPLAFFVPYRLLPDWVPGKGQGYLGDTNVAWEILKVPKALDQANELLVQGTGANGNITRVSIFRWSGLTQGYTVTTFQGSYSASIEPGRDPGDVVREVVTLNAQNDRSNLCAKVTWTRQGDTAAFIAGPPAIVFCLGTPAQPTYPEAVVLAYLLNPNNALVVEGRAGQIQAVVPGGVSRVVTLSYPGTITTVGTGASAVAQTTVDTIIVDPQGQYHVLWTLQEQRPTPDDKTTRWRILAAEKG